MKKCSEVQKQLNAIRDEIRAVCDRQDQLHEIAKARGIERFEAASGCATCRGRGWVVTWDTMDYLDGSAAAYGDCTNKSCTPETRKASGFYPENTRYDHNRYATWAHMHDLTELEKDESFMIQPQIVRLNKKFNDIEISARPTKGKLVEVVAKSRARNSAAIGEKGKVFWYGVNDWGTVKVGLMDTGGNKHWTTEVCVKVVSQTAGKKYDQKYEDQYPLLCKVVRRSNKAICVMTPGQSKFAGGEWIPWSQILNADQVREQLGTGVSKLPKDGKAATVMIPPWLAKKKGYIRD
jgi:hypothetical protein